MCSWFGKKNRNGTDGDHNRAKSHEVCCLALFRWPLCWCLVCSSRRFPSSEASSVMIDRIARYFLLTLCTLLLVVVGSANGLGHQSHVSLTYRWWPMQSKAEAAPATPHQPFDPSIQYFLIAIFVTELFLDSISLVICSHRNQAPVSLSSRLCFYRKSYRYKKESAGEAEVTPNITRCLEWKANR